MAIVTPGGNPSPLGKIIVATAGTEVPLTQNFAGLTSDEAKKNMANQCAWITVQANASNTDNVFVGLNGMNTTTMAGVFAILAPGAMGSFNLNECPNGLDINDFYLDAAVSGEWAIAVMAGR
jgi:hypothetical protein